MHDRIQVSSSRRPTFVVLAVVALILAACSLPQFGQEPAATAEAFEVTPYAPETSSPDAPSSSNESVESNDVSQSADGSAGAPSEANQESENIEATSTVSDSAPTLASSQQYNGEIVAKDRTTIVSETSGMALDVDVEVGNELMAGDLLVQVDTSILEAQRAQALAGLEAAQSQLDLLLEDAEEEDLEAARAGVSAAAAAYRRALDGPTEEDERTALAQLRQAEAAVTVAQAGYNEVKGNPMIAALPQSLQLQQATLQLEAAQAQYDKILKGSTDDIIAGAYAQLAQARAQLARLEEGAKDAQIQAARAQVKQAETVLYLAQLQLDKATIHTPVGGTVSDVYTTIGSMLAPGSPVVTLLSPIMEVVIQLEEYRLSELELGQQAVLRVDAYPGKTFEGEVIRIAPELDPGTRTVAVTIQPEDDDLLAPGMFATVELIDTELIDTELIDTELIDTELIEQ